MLWKIIKTASTFTTLVGQVPVYEIFSGIVFIAIIVYIINIAINLKKGEEDFPENQISGKKEEVKTVRDSKNPKEKELNVKKEEEKSKKIENVKENEVEWKKTKKY